MQTDGMALIMDNIAGLIVILGSPNDDKGNLSEMGRGRVELGYHKYRELRAAGWKILLTGGFGEHFNTTAYPNAYYARQILLKQGVPPGDIVGFALSRNTVDDAWQARKIVEQYHCPALIVVSSDFHIPRVEFVFRSVFPDHALVFAAAAYLESRPPEERDRLIAHERRTLANLKKRGVALVNEALNDDLQSVDS
ncbi:MAG: YdcF family protein [Kiritimatiellia bacterium]|nr:YdcF family protein [Lentisphaerota bacterium]